MHHPQQGVHRRTPGVGASAKRLQPDKFPGRAVARQPRPRLELARPAQWAVGRAGPEPRAGRPSASWPGPREQLEADAVLAQQPPPGARRTAARSRTAGRKSGSSPPVTSKPALGTRPRNSPAPRPGCGCRRRCSRSGAGSTGGGSRTARTYSLGQRRRVYRPRCSSHVRSGAATVAGSSVERGAQRRQRGEHRAVRVAQQQRRGRGGDRPMHGVHGFASGLPDRLRRAAGTARRACPCRPS